MKQSVLKSFVSAVLFSIAVAGCSSSTTSQPPTQVTPGKASTFTTTETDTASGGGTSQRSTRDSVLATGLTVGAKTNVMKSVTMDATGHSGPLDTSYTVYEANGDVSTMGPQTLSLSAEFPGFTWLTLTVASQKTDTLVTKDSTITIAGFPVTAHFALISMGAGTGSATIKGKTFSTESATVLLTASAPGLGPYALRKSTITFAPGLGWAVSQDSPALAPVFGLALQPTGFHVQLTDYTEF
ncbi:MAG: hypothetical protein Q8922_05460 [Bacteroidota bacterium]|nr:hypothetical protein [Bacteroidota bacterium]MDP4233150.1 hypothetical protein [Bacteroidota bacterium]MDP4241705.1 hypothetical protein [Bacteroidota bacterium]MDP4287363.1 hypothetical protein [Bacteroidota bacterium]